MDADQILRALNRERNWRTMVFAANSDARHGKGATPAPAEQYREAVAAFRVRLHKLAEEWIESGWRDGYEYPKERILRPGTGAHKALTRWLRFNRSAAYIAETGETRYDVAHRHQSYPVGSQDNPIRRMRREATGLFWALMNADPLKFQLSKCGQCRQYYFRKKLRSLYKGGKFFCQECLKAGATVDKVRAEKQEKRIKEAALALGRWPGLPEEDRAKHKSDEAYAAHCIKRHGVGIGWVTRHLDEVKQYQQDGCIVGKL